MTRPTFRPGEPYDQSRTATTKTLPPVDPRRAWRRGYLEGWADAARDIKAGCPRQSFGSFATTAYAAGYQACVKEHTR